MRSQIITPIDQGLDILRIRCLVEILVVECRYLADVAIVQFIKAAGFNDSDSQGRIFR